MTTLNKAASEISYAFDIHACTDVTGFSFLGPVSYTHLEVYKRQPYMTVSAVWTIADIFNGLMALPNMIALFALSGVCLLYTSRCV